MTKNIYKNGIYYLKKINPNEKGSCLALFEISLKRFNDYTPLTLPKKNLYKTLGIKETSDLKEIKQAYYKKAKEYHPDKFVSF